MDNIKTILTIFNFFILITVKTNIPLITTIKFGENRFFTNLSLHDSALLTERDF